MIATHGGDGEAEARRLGLGPDALIDASANIAPEAPPAVVEAVLRAIDPACLTRYPDPAYGPLRAAAARAYGVAPERIVVGNGSASLIAAALHALGARGALLPVPAFSEYRKALVREAIPYRTRVLPAADGFRPSVHALRPGAPEGADVVLLANPNNPTGAHISGEAMLALVDAFAAARVRAIVDEAFVDYLPDAALLPGAIPDGTVVLRSMTKFHAIPGIRVGFAIAAPAIAARMQAALPSWPIGAIDAAIATAVLETATHADADRRRAENASRRIRFVAALAAIGLTPFPAAANFLFLDTRPFFSASGNTLRSMMLEREHVLVRACDDYEGLPSGAFVRLAVLDDARNARVVEALARVLSASKVRT